MGLRGVQGAVRPRLLLPRCPFLGLGAFLTAPPQGGAVLSLSAAWKGCRLALAHNCSAYMCYVTQGFFLCLLPGEALMRFLVKWQDGSGRWLTVSRDTRAGSLALIGFLQAQGFRTFLEDRSRHFGVSGDALFLIEDDSVIGCRFSYPEFFFAKGGD